MRKTPQFRGRKPASALSSRIKSKNRAAHTSPELQLRRALSRLGAHYRLHSRDLSGRPDIVFRRAKVAVFVDGDFWHGRNWASRKRRLAKGTNPDYWVAKIQANRLRDRRHSASLKSLGWLVIRVWESEVGRDADGIAARIVEAVNERLQTSGRASVTLESHKTKRGR